MFITFSYEKTCPILLLLKIYGMRKNEFFKQRTSLAEQIANAACVLGTKSDKSTFDETFNL